MNVASKDGLKFENFRDWHKPRLDAVYRIKWIEVETVVEIVVKNILLGSEMCPHLKGKRSQFL